MYEVLGKEKVNYTNKIGNPVNGIKLHVTSESKRVEGLKVEVVYCSGLLADEVEVGNTVDFLYNKYGNVQSVTVLG